MFTVTKIGLASLWLALAGFTAGVANAAELSRLDESRALAQSFGQRLKGELTAAMAAGGPVEAVKVCRDRAPQLASELSRSSGARVARTSLRYRNPINAPDPWEAQMLAEFERLVASGQTDPADLEVSQTSTTGRFHYLSAIRTQPLCLTCHGSAIDPATAAELNAAYPHDLATGYTAGEVRGAFSIVWPRETQTAEELRP